jgi:hypothetical protein
LRKLVEAARREGAGKAEKRRAQEAAYRVMTALGGDRPGYEEATRALFAGDLDTLARFIAPWPEDIRTYALELAQHQKDA